jgi:hypothetical protein
MFNELNSYTKTHYNIVEFWHKTNFLGKIELDSISLKSNKDDEMLKYHSFSNKNKIYQKTFDWHTNGGNFKMTLKNKEKYYLLQNIRNNLKKTLEDFIPINAVIYNKYSSFYHSELMGIGVSSINEENNTGFSVMTGWYVKQII